MTHPAPCLIVALLALALPVTPLDAQTAPSADEALAKIDARLFFPDAQDGMSGYQAELSVWSGMAGTGGKINPDPKGTKPAGKVEFRDGTKKQTDAAGAEVAPGSFTPFCGPWTLTALMTFEVEWFAQPWSKRFAADAWSRECSSEGSGTRLTLTPKQTIGEAFMLRPALVGLEVVLDAEGVPQTAVLKLDQKMMHDDGEAKFTFTEVGGKKRIARIENTLRSANLVIAPALIFNFGKVGTCELPQMVEFRVPGGGLSGTMAGQDMITLVTWRYRAPPK